MSSALVTVNARQGVPQWDQIDSCVLEWKPTVLVVGMPYNMDGSNSPMSKQARQFADKLQERYKLPVEMIDERLTSVEAGMLLREQRSKGLRKKKVGRSDIDSLAAQLIGESWLNSD